MPMVKQPIDSRSSERLRHERVEPGRMDVGRDRKTAPFIGRVRDPVEGLGLEHDRGLFAVTSTPPALFRKVGIARK